MPNKSPSTSSCLCTWPFTIHRGPRDELLLETINPTTFLLLPTTIYIRTVTTAVDVDQLMVIMIGPHEWNVFIEDYPVRLKLPPPDRGDRCDLLGVGQIDRRDTLSRPKALPNHCISQLRPTDDRPRLHWLTERWWRDFRGGLPLNTVYNWSVRVIIIISSLGLTRTPSVPHYKGNLGEPAEYAHINMFDWMDGWDGHDDDDEEGRQMCRMMVISPETEESLTQYSRVVGCK